MNPLKMKTYKAKKGGLITCILLGILAVPLLTYLFDPRPFNERLNFLMIFLMPSTIIFWPYFDTYYQIDNQILKYKSGYIKGAIEIGFITNILKGKTRWVGIKPALATGGLIVKYNRYDDVYLAPEDSETFIKDLLSVNPSIQVIPSEAMSGTENA